MAQNNPITAESLFRRAAMMGAGDVAALEAMFNITGAAGPDGVPQVLYYQQAGYLDVGNCPQVYGVPDDCPPLKRRRDGTCIGAISARSIAKYCPPGMEGKPVFLSTSHSGRNISWAWQLPPPPTEEEKQAAILALARKLMIRRTIMVLGGTGLAVGAFLFFRRR